MGFVASCRTQLDGPEYRTDIHIGNNADSDCPAVENSFRLTSIAPRVICLPRRFSIDGTCQDHSAAVNSRLESGVGSVPLDRFVQRQRRPRSITRGEGRGGGPRAFHLVSQRLFHCGPGCPLCSERLMQEMPSGPKDPSRPNALPI